MNSLTKREKVLLTIGAVFIIIFAMSYFLIIPAYNEYMEKSERLDELLFEKMQVDDKIAGMQGVVAAYERTAAEYEELSSHFSDRLTSYELDMLITGICLRHNLTPTYLSMTNVVYDDSRAVTNMALKITVSAGYSDIQRLINTINDTDYIYISSFSYTQKDNDINVDMSLNVQTLDKAAS